MKRIVVFLFAALAGCATAPQPQTPAPPPASSPAALPPSVMPSPENPKEPESAPADTPAPEAPAAAPTPARPQLTLRDFAALNDNRLLDVYEGMSKLAVERTMAMHQTDRFVNPYKRQTLHLKDGTVYEVAFYLTRMPARGKPITERQLTPVIFRGNKVFAIGHYRLKKLRRSLGY